MSTRTARIFENRSFFLVALALAGAGCQPPQFSCPDGYQLAPEGRCFGIDAGAMPMGDAGPMIADDAGVDATIEAQDAAVVPGDDATVERPDAYVELPDAYVELPDAYVAPDACDYRTWYVDGDGDGYGDPSMPRMACAQPSGTVSAPTDCADGDSARHPGAIELCNGQDDDCNGLTDDGVVHPTFYVDADGDGYGGGAAVTTFCTLPSGYAVRNGDCDDTRAATNPGATEMCNTIDDNCDGRVDEGLTRTYYADCDGDSFAAAGAVPMVACPTPAPPICPGSGTVRLWTETAPTSAANTDCSDANGSLRPDNRYFPDCDGDGYAAAGARATASCATPTAMACTTAPASTAGGRWTLRDPSMATPDCYDFEAHAYPGSTYSSTSGYSTGVGNSYDYDCDGEATTVITAVDSGSCHFGPFVSGCQPAMPTWVGSAPRCGNSGTLYTCGGTVCAPMNTVGVFPACH